MSQSSEVAVRTLLVTDLVESTKTVGEVGDVRASEISAIHDREARGLLAETGGSEIDKSDGFLFLFERPLDALAYALRYHEKLRELTARLGVSLEARAGIHLGEVHLRQNPPEHVARGAKPLEVEGIAKPAAARVMSLAVGGQTLLTRSAFDLARRAAVGSPVFSQRLSWLAHGSFHFKGVPEPEEIFEVGMVDEAPLTRPPDSEKAHRILGPGDEVALGWRAAPRQAIPSRPGWLLTEKLGEGGFGEIWLASHQKSSEKRVFKFCYEAERLRALQREVTVFRLLKETLGHRDDIARIIDWNFEEKPYFLESDYSVGGSLIDWSDELGGIDTVPLAMRLELAAQVADALSAAHSVGILHKDVKPANVLITKDKKGDPKAVLTDFGIGLITDRDLLAAQGITAAGFTELTALQTDSGYGSYMFMAPELFEGKAPTTQADIYSLGVLIFQLAAGDLSRSLGPGWRRDVSDELLRDDISSFVDRNPDRRPRSALEVAERLRRLDARRAELEAERESIRKAEIHQKRRKVFAVSGIAAAVFLVVVSILAFQAITARHEAEQRRTQAEDLIDFILLDLKQSLEPIGQLDILEQAARKSQEYFESLPREDLDVAALKRRAISLLNVGDVFLDKGDTADALQAFSSASAILEQLAIDYPDQPHTRADLAECDLKIGEVFLRRDEAVTARGWFEKALESYTALMDQEPENKLWLGGVARAQASIGGVHSYQHDSATALSWYRNSNQIYEQLAQDDPEDGELQLVLAKSRKLVGSTLNLKGQAQDALSAMRSALIVYRRLAVRNPENKQLQSDTATTEYQIGFLLFSETIANYREAIESFERARAIYKHLMEHDPLRVDWLARFAETHEAIGWGHQDLGDLETALQFHKEAYRLRVRLRDMDDENDRWPRWMAYSAEQIGQTLLALGRYQDALRSLKGAAESYQELVEKDSSDLSRFNRLSWTYVQIGQVHARLGQSAQARRAWTRAVEIIEPITQQSQNSPFIDTHAQALLHLGRADEARPLVATLKDRDWSESSLIELAMKHGLWPEK